MPTRPGHFQSRPLSGALRTTASCNRLSVSHQAADWPGWRAGMGASPCVWSCTAIGFIAGDNPWFMLVADGHWWFLPLMRFIVTEHPLYRNIDRLEFLLSRLQIGWVAASIMPSGTERIQDVAHLTWSSIMNQYDRHDPPLLWWSSIIHSLYKPFLTIVKHY